MKEWIKRLAIVSDEASLDFSEAVEICLPLGVEAYELRSLKSGRIPFVDEADIRQVEEITKRHHLTLVGVSPGFFKREISDPAGQVEFEEGFPRVFRLMDRLDIRQMTVFSFRREGDRQAPIPDRVIETLGTAVQLCREQGVNLLIENSAGCWGDTGANAAKLAEAAGAQLTWDPGNAAAAGDEAFPSGYRSAKPFIRHVHFKNRLPDGKWSHISTGVVDMRGQVSSLKTDGYDGYFCVEPHQWDNRKEASRKNIGQLLQLLEKGEG